MKKIRLNLDYGKDEISTFVPFSVAPNGTSFPKGQGATANNSGFEITIDKATYDCTVLGIIPPGSPKPKWWAGVSSAACRPTIGRLMVSISLLVSLVFYA